MLRRQAGADHSVPFEYVNAGDGEMAELMLLAELQKIRLPRLALLLPEVELANY